LGENPIAWADVMNTPGPDSDAVERNGDGWEVDLTDRTDDFDFVYDDQASGPVDRFDFTALDGTERTDTWLDTTGELTEGTDPWDPDTDDDGLTDGQETDGLTQEIQGIGQPTSIIEDDLETTDVTELDPTDPDSDDDGYWDGWIGVYGVSYENTSQHILYRHNLEGGINGDEILQRQLGTHSVDAAPTPAGQSATIEGGCPRIDGTTASSEQCHSNVHVGELLLGSEPTSQVDLGGEENGLPDTTVRLEVDFYAGASSAIVDNQEAWLDRIRTNYQLYGIDLRYVSEANGGNETITDAQLNPDLAVGDHQPPFSVADLNWIADEDNIDAYSDGFHQTSHPYMFVGTRAGGGLNSFQTGLQRFTDNRDETEWMTVFTDPTNSNHAPFRAPGRLGLSNAEARRAVTSKTAVHEIGHHLSLGENEANDVPGGETYSGSDNDNTPENVTRTIGNSDLVTTWSVMSSGVDRINFIPPTDDHYTAFSIEELLTIDESRPE